MSSPAHTCARLLAALEDLVSQEASLLRAADFAGVLATQERAAPIVERLAALAPAAPTSPMSMVNPSRSARARRNGASPNTQKGGKSSSTRRAYSDNT
ncbi:MAG: hypothetical protein H7343_15595, partial [Undibacterium sp.]|nr:hypothetical protein [Opitutaceae bacterium]